MSTGIYFELGKIFPVKQEKLFDAFLNESVLTKIWGVKSIKIDAKPGGNAIAEFNINGENWNFTLTYKQIIPFEKLTWKVQFERFPEMEILADLTFSPVNGGTALKVKLDNFLSNNERDANKAAWVNALNSLEGILTL
jgi:hypothetical protein